ncbi:MAG TPA: hypothetical protein P5110_09785 [Candidatus Omnitrophota bacterium]|nr:hypothetical protein [Candidatus Omnitrophota bacterium]HRZ15785.1 hypothetical protein [Candidatus Omnitrophota bacterium]
MEKAAERTLVLQFKCAKEKRDAIKESLKLAQEEYEKTEFALIEFMESNSAVATAKYEGIGYAQIQKPRLYASCKEENMERLFEFLKEQGREDLIKTTVLPQSLSSFTSECIETGAEVPEFVSYYLKPSIRLYS